MPNYILELIMDSTKNTEKYLMKNNMLKINKRFD